MTDGRTAELGFWVFGPKEKKTGFSPPFASFAASHTHTRALLREPGRFFSLGKLLCSHQVCCCFRFAIGPAGFFFCRRWTCRSSRSIVVRLLSLTSFSAGDLVHRLCMSSSYGCASCRLCLLRRRVSIALVPTSFPPLIPAGPSVSKELRRYGTARTR